MPRVFELTTPLGKDVLFFRALRGSEQLGRLSQFELSTLSDSKDIRLGDLLGKNVTVRVELRGGGFRFFNGFVTSFGQEGTVGRFFHYRLTVQPWLWFLTRTTDCRIFQDKTAPEIIKEIFAEHPVAVFEDLLTGKHPKREYCVQYRETDFNFVSRLMEEEGIYYFFEHQDGRHVLKMVDATSAHKVLENKATITYIPPGGPVRDDDEFIHTWNFSQSIQAGVVALDDYDFTKPRADLGVKAKILETHEQADFEVFDYPGEYHETDDGEQYARARIEELHSEFDRAEAECNVREVSVGRLFTLTNAPRRDQEREYLITSARYDLRDNPFETAPGAPTSYSCRFTVLHTRQQYRPERTTLEPKMTGPQTAVVMAPPNEEIFCDKFGRVKVLFHWDREGKKKRDENTSCFLRIAHPWAGTGWGVIFLPRKGQEVLVDFLEGDPDQPIIVGSVYNADEMPPYKLPDFKTMSTIKSRSTLNGDPKQFNELRFEDKQGKEQVFLHSQRRMDVRVKQSMFETIGGARNTGIGGEFALTIGGNNDEHIKQARYNRINGTLESSVGGTVGVIIDGATSKVVNGALSISAPQIVLEAKTQISLKVGTNCVVIDNSGVSIAGIMVRINSGGYGTDASDVDLDDPLEAEAADTGEPGFLDRPRRGGGGGRKKRHASAQHAQSIPRPGESAAVTALRQRLALTPSGRHALEVYDRYGVKPSFVPGNGSFYSGSKFKDNTMNLDPNDPDPEGGFVHEMNHAQGDHEGATVFGKEKSTSQADYRNSMLNEEAQGMALEGQYAREQAARGTPVANPPPYTAAYNTAYQNGVNSAKAANPNATPQELDAAGKKAGADAMRNQLDTGAVTTSTNGQTYPQYYDGIWANDNKP
jgi:type VI secretion system secreted protein VgrG